MGATKQSIHVVMLGAAVALATAGGPAAGQAADGGTAAKGSAAEGRALLWAYIDAGRKEAAALRARLVESGATAGQVADWLSAGRPAKPVEPRDTPWREIKVKAVDGRERAAVLRIPEAFKSWEKRHPLVVELHGGVSYPKPRPTKEMKETDYSIVEKVADRAFYLQPKGTRRAMWFDKVGSDNVRKAIAEVRRRYPIDPNRIYLSGFSDGAHGTYYFAATHPEAFAGFVPLNGMPMMAQVAGEQVHMRNLLNKPLYIVNTGKDMLNPTPLVRRQVNLLKKAEAPLEFEFYANLPHAPIYMKQEIDKITKWMSNTVREPYPSQLVWETADAKRSPGLHWLAVRKIGSVGNDHAFADINFETGGRGVRLGVGVDRQWRGKGVKVTGVEEKSVAAGLGMKRGDVIVGFDGKAIAGFDPLRKAIDGKSPGDAMSVEVRREGEADPLTFRGKFPDAKPNFAFKREKPHGSIRAEYADNRFDVQVKRVAEFELALSPAMVDFDKPIVVAVNGEVVHERKVAPSLAAALDRARRHADPAQVYTAALRIEVPAR